MAFTATNENAAIIVQQAVVEASTTSARAQLATQPECRTILAWFWGISGTHTQMCSSVNRSEQRCPSAIAAKACAASWSVVAKMA